MGKLSFDSEKQLMPFKLITGELIEIYDSEKLKKQNTSLDKFAVFCIFIGGLSIGMSLGSFLTNFDNSHKIVRLKQQKQIIDSLENEIEIYKIFLEK